MLQVRHVLLGYFYYYSLSHHISLLSHLGEKGRQSLEEEILDGGGHSIDCYVQSVDTEAGILVKVLEDEIHVSSVMLVLL